MTIISVVWKVLLTVLWLGGLLVTISMTQTGWTHIRSIVGSKWPEFLVCSLFLVFGVSWGIDLLKIASRAISRTVRNYRRINP